MNDSRNQPVSNATGESRADFDRASRDAWVRIALEASRQGIWEYDLDRDVAFVNGLWCEILGIHPPVSELPVADIMGMIHPDDRTRMNAERDAIHQDGYRLSATFRIITPSGETRWIESNGQYIPNPAGERKRYVGVIADVTVQKEEALRIMQRERMLTELIEKLPAGAVLLNDEDLQYNRAIEGIIGYSQGEITTRAGWFRALFGDEIQEHLANYHRNRSSGFSELALVEFRRKDGEQRLAEIAAAITGEGEIWLMRDVTEERALNAQLNAERSRLHLATDAGKIGIWELRFSDGRMTWDEQLQRMFGLKEEDNEQSWDIFLKLLHPADSHNVIENWEIGVAEGLPLGTEFRIIRPDGQLRHIRAKGQIETAPDGTPLRAVGANWDITEEREAAAALSAAKDAAEAAERAKSEFLAMVSHEIRTPMNTVLGMTRLALQTELTRKQHNYLSKINSAATSLIEIISDFLDFSKMEAGKLQLEMSAFNIDTVLESVSSVLAMKAEEKGLEIIYRVDPAVTGLFVGDPMRLGQILINLVSNAVKFTDQGEILVSVARDPEGPDAENGLIFSVRDTGIGLDEAQIARIFQAFTQAGSYITRSYGGTGLGLAICKQLVELMGGRIWVESELGKGSTFFFTVDSIYPIESTERTASRQLSGLSHRRVLVVDDSASAREVLSTMLRGFGMDSDAAHDGAEALGLLQQASERNLPYELVLMDWRMPGIDGLETARRIKSDPGLRRTPAVLMVTAFAREEILLRVEQLRLEGVLIKPVTESVMFNTIAEALGYSNTEQLATGRRTPRDVNRLRGRHVLLVDDNAMNREVIFEFLTQVGVIVETAENGAEAIRRVEERAFDAMLLDSRMPDMDGVEVTRILRGDPRFASLPILAISANSGSDDRQASLDAGATAYLTKPIDPDRLYETLLQHMPFTPSTAGLSGLSVLVVDDNALNREVLEDFLLGVGMFVVTAVDGIDALDKLKDSQVDLVLMDIHMPRMDGLAATREIRKTHSRADLPIIAVTAVAQSSDRDASFAAGMNAHLAKPIDETLLFDTIARLVAGDREQAVADISEIDDLPALTSADSPPGIDLDVALAHLGGKQDRLIRLLRGFHRDFSDLPVLLPSDVETANFEAIELVGHTLKSSAGYLGATELANAATVLDTAARHRDLSEVEATAPALIERLETVLTGLEGLFARIEQPPAIAAIDHTAVNALIDQALPLVAQGEYTAMTPLDKLVRALATTSFEPLGELARSLFEELDLEAAAEALSRLRAGLHATTEAS